MLACYAINPPEMFLYTEIMVLIHDPKTDFQSGSCQVAIATFCSECSGELSTERTGSASEEEEEEVLQAAPNLLVFYPVIGEDLTTMQLCAFLAKSLHEDIQSSLGLHAVQHREVEFACFL